jgi:hypothetical protein
MNEAFQAIIDKHRARMKLLRDTFDRDGRVHAVSQADPSYAILLTVNGSSAAPFRVTSFRSKEPIGHREYDALDGKGATRDALAEFAGDGWNLVPLPKRMRERRIKEAEEGYAACADILARSRGDPVFERSLRIWKRRLELLKPGL